MLDKLELKILSAGGAEDFILFFQGFGRTRDPSCSGSSTDIIRSIAYLLGFQAVYTGSSPADLSRSGGTIRVAAFSEDERGRGPTSFE